MVGEFVYLIQIWTLQQNLNLNLKPKNRKEKKGKIKKWEQPT
jgi:hypothetical protein